MPVAVHIAAASAHDESGAASVGVRCNPDTVDLKTVSNVADDSSGNVSGQDFGALVRKQAGVVHPTILAVAADGMKAVGAGPITDTVELAPELKGKTSPAAEQAKTNAEPVGTAGDEVGPFTPRAAVLDSPETLLANQMKESLIGKGRGPVASPAAEVGGNAALDGKSSGEKPGEPHGAMGDADKKVGQNGYKKREAASAAAIGSPPVMAAMDGSTVVPPILLMQVGVAAPKVNPAPVLQDAKSIYSQGAPSSAQDVLNGAEDHNPAAGAPTLISQAMTRGRNLVSAGAQSAGSPVSDGVAESKGLEDTVKASAVAPADAPRSSTPRVPGNQAIAPAMVPAPAHGGETVSAVEHMAQPASAPASVAAPATSAPAFAGSAYDRMDQGVAPVMLHSGAQHVSVGVQDPNLGWVEIKTQNLGGHVDATLVTASGQSRDALSTQLPAMAQFLEQRDVRIGVLAVHHEFSGGQGNFSSGTGSGTNHGGGAGYSGHAGSGSGSGTGGESKSAYAELSSRLPRRAAVPGVGVGEEAGLRPLSYISVRA